MYVIGTAGHVDHGKSALTEAISGIDPDRLRQEKERGMTIELGFAWVTLPGGLEVSIVDVPGHERFIKNMLMGVGGIDMALLIVAADEGVMPQTREHLAILDLLQIDRGVVAITKRDLVEDDWLELVHADVEQLLAGTSLEGSEAVAVSAVTGEGIEDLLRTVESALAGLPEKRDLGRPRLPVDRSFTISGFGTVVTGTLTDGRLRVGQEVVILPSNARARVRGLQTHRKAETEALPGTRTAVNLSGVSYEDIGRGDVLTTPGWLQPTDALDVRLRVIDDAPRALRHNASVTFFSGSSETLARVRLLDANSLPPGKTGWAQIKLERPVALVKGDYFVVRNTVTTLGGGTVVDPYARRHRRFHDATIARLEMLAEGSEQSALIGALESAEPSGIGEIARLANLSEAAVRSQIAALVASGEVVALSDEGPGIYYSARGWAALSERARKVLASYHEQYPLRSGMPKEELRNRLKMRTAAFIPALARLEGESVLATDEALARLPGYQAALTDEQRRVADGYLETLASNPYSPPTDRKIDPELLGVLSDRGQVVRATADVVFLASAYEEMESRVIEYARAHASVSLAAVREMFGTSRKYTLALLEHMDRRQITRRLGDDRVLR